MSEGFAEQGIIASVMDHPHILPSVRDALALHDFLREKHRVVWRAIRELDDEGHVPGWDSILDHLNSAGDLPKVGGVTGLAEMIDGVARFEDVRTLVAQVRKRSINHQIELEREAMRLEVEDGESPATSLEKHLPRLIELQRQAAGGGSTDAQIDNLGCTGAELETDEDVAVDWIALGYIAKGCLAEFNGKVKGGKTTLAMALVRACLFGGDFLGHYVEQCRVVYVTEQGKVSFKAQAKESGILGSENLTIIFKHELSPFSWDKRVSLVMAKATKVGARVVFWDTFGALAGLKDDGENSDEAGRKMRDLSEAAAVSGLAIVALRHARKSEGEASDAGRGHSGMTGAVDVSVLLKKSATNQGANIRELEMISRFPETPQSAVIELVGQHYRLLGDAGSIRHDRNQTSVLESLPIEPDGYTLEQVMNATGLKRETTRSTLSQLRENGKVKMCGKGVSRNPFVYSIPASVSQDDGRQKLHTQDIEDVDLSKRSEFVPESAREAGRDFGRTPGPEEFLSTSYREESVGRQTFATEKVSVYQEVNSPGSIDRQTLADDKECPLEREGDYTLDDERGW